MVTIQLKKFAGLHYRRARHHMQASCVNLRAAGGFHPTVITGPLARSLLCQFVVSRFVERGLYAVVEFL